MYDVTEITKIAQALGIKLTNAEEGTEIYQCWADRVEEAKMHDDRATDAWDCRPDSGDGEIEARRRDIMCAEANRYAI
jgi:hypothetical protein